MSWKKYFRVADTSGRMSPVPSFGHSNLTGQSDELNSHVGYRNWQSNLPEVYSGHPNRVERYNQYEAMDIDSEINACLDIIAEFSTQTNEQNHTAFELNYKESPTDNEIKILSQQLKQWVKLNQFDKRIFKIFRNTIKYGDQVFIRDPETFELSWVETHKVTRVIVNESKGKEPEQYLIQDINPNFENLTVAAKTTQDFQTQPPGGGYTAPFNYTVPNQPNGNSGRFSNNPSETAIDSQHIVHLSLTEGLDVFWPFGVSVLENVFKVYKQKELLEDAVLIYRIQRAPERRVFYIDVGNMAPHLAMGFVERVKNEIHQRRIPTENGGGANMLDASYNPMSINEDYFFPQCLSQNTKIPLMDGRELTLRDVITEYNAGKDNYAYSLNLETQELEPGKITWGGVTRKDAKIVRVTLDNGEYIDATPDHRFILRDGSECNAEDLQENDSLMPLYLMPGKTSPKQKGKPYMRYIDNATGKVKWVHTTVCQKSKPGKEFVIHHKDFDSKNNNPTNLIEMSAEDHTALHKAVGTYSLQKQWDNPNSRQKLLDSIHKLHAQATHEFKEMLVNRGRKNGANTWSNLESAKRTRDALKITQARVSKAKTIQIDDAMYERVCELFTNGYNSISKICKILRVDEEFQNNFRNANKNLLRDKNKPMTYLVTDRQLNKIVQHGGFERWGNFKEEYKFNHKVVSVTILNYTEDTCDITVESESNSHIFATSAGIYVHNSAEGRGSKVDTLPGGENLGDIDDLKYFNNKLARGLRVPSSYLPTGPEEKEITMADGKMGTALIQEYRFNQYCERLQRQVITNLNKEFKMFLAWRGFNIDSSIFDLEFNAPQNFASYRQGDLDATRLANWGSVADVPYLSKRFALKRFLGLTEEEMAENEEMWREENGKDGSIEVEGSDMRGVGVGPGDFDADMEAMGDMEADLEAEGGEEPGMGGGMEAEGPGQTNTPEV